MTAQSPSAFVSSALLHAAVVALLLLLGYELSQNQAEAPKIFELVAGAGDNYAATAAPALGSPDAPEIRVPTPPAPAPVPPAPAPEPVAQATAEAAPAPVEAKVPPKPAAKPTPNFLRTVKNTVRRAESRVETRIKKQQAAAEAKRQMTLAEFQKEHPEKVAQGRGIAAGVVGGSVANTKGGAGGKALTREQGSEMDAYFALLMSRIRENHQQPADVSTSLTAKVEFHLGADGTISGVRIVRSSGSEEFDQSVKEAFARTRPILPPTFFKGDTLSLDFALDETTQN
jgi:TonB family protein